MRIAIAVSCLWVSAAHADPVICKEPSDSMKDRVLEVYTKVREARNLQFDVIRRGKPVAIRVTVK